MVQKGACMPNFDYIAYTDGSCLGNPNKGAYCAIVEETKSRKSNMITRGFKMTTNNRMELMAVVKAVAMIPKGKSILVHSDSKYVIDAITKGWLNTWLSKSDFAGKKNEDLWRFYMKVSEGKAVSFKWVKGHSGVELNEACDRLAKQTAKGSDLQDDIGYRV